MRYLTRSLITILVLLLAACGGDGATPLAEPPTAEAEQAAATVEANEAVIEEVEAAPADNEEAEPVDPKATTGVEAVASEVPIAPAAEESVNSGPDELPEAVEVAAANPPLPQEISLPPGFRIGYYAENVPNARSMALSPNGTLFVGTRDAGNLYAILDSNQDYVADEVITLAEGMNSPNGVAFRDEALYVAEINRILRFDNIEESLPELPEAVVINADYPSDWPHGWKFIRFGPDGRLYVPVGAPCNVCQIEGTPYGKITSIATDGSDLLVYADGVRNSVGFDWHPETGVLWFTDNGRDNLGDDVPPDELNRAPEAGLHFGFPYCHGETIPDPEFGSQRSCAEFTPPAQALGPHVAALGMRFYTGNLFPEEYHNQVFIAEHGSWNRTIPIGYRLSLARLEESEVVSYEVFAEGWLRENGERWGRPVDVQVMPDGSLLVSDDMAGAIYRIWYEPAGH
ncbi:MAG: PQQ-dependent sugar dehydrogenase [Candidatus Promineifilaceae bacterium]|nr:PQQ-dependent sugar dehydrogenase [Candidatus Promineifilaceae bacterium]